MSGTNVVAEIGDTLNKEPIYQEKQPETDRENSYLREIPELGYHMAGKRFDSTYVDSGYACYKDILIVGNSIYKRRGEDGTGKYICLLVTNPWKAGLK